MPGAGCRTYGARHHRNDLGVHGAPLAAPGRDQALAVPVLDLHPRPGLPAQGRTRAGPVQPHLAGRAPRTGRVRHQRRREDLRPGPLPLPPHPGPGAGPGDAGQPHLRQGWRSGLPCRLRRPPRPGVRPNRDQDRHRPVHEPGHPGHESGTLRKRQTGVLDRGQRLLAPRAEGRRPTDRRVPKRGHGAHPFTLRG